MTEQEPSREQLAAEVLRLRAALGRAHETLQMAKGHITKLEVDYLQSEPDVNYIDALLADPTGQQAAQEWARMQAVVEATRLYFSEGRTPGGWAEVREEHARRLMGVKDALAALQPPAEVGEGQG